MSTKTKKTELLKFIEADGLGPIGRTNKTVVRLAKKSGLSAEGIYRVARGDYHLRKDNAVKLSKATGGKVSTASLVGL